MGLAGGEALSMTVFGVGISVPVGNSFLRCLSLALVHAECLVFIADEFSIRDLCFCQERGPEPRLFPMEAKTEKCGKREGYMGYVQGRPFVFLFRD